MKKIIVASILSSLCACGGGSSGNKNTAVQESGNVKAPETSTANGAGVTAPTPSVSNPGSVVETPADNSPIAVNVKFNAKVGLEDLLCSDKSAAMIARGQIFTDFRLFLSNLSFVNEQGEDVALNLDIVSNNTNLQFVDKDKNSIALLNYLEASCASSDATKTLKSAISGMLPPGNYSAIKFQIGLPYASMDSRLVAIPASLAPSDMGWMWEHFPADLQIEANKGLAAQSAKKIFNALTTANKKIITLPVNYSINAQAKSDVSLNIDLAKLFLTDGQAFLDGLESACKDSTSKMSESSPNCAHAYKAFGLDVANPLAAYSQTVFSIAE